jgi:hypothetical protein
VVHLMQRPLTFHVKPREPGRTITLPVNTNFAVATSVKIPRNSTSTNWLPFLRSTPSKRPSLRGILKEFSKPLSGQGTQCSHQYPLFGTLANLVIRASFPTGLTRPSFRDDLEAMDDIGLPARLAGAFLIILFAPSSCSMICRLTKLKRPRRLGSLSCVRYPDASARGFRHTDLAWLSNLRRLGFET